MVPPPRLDDLPEEEPGARRWLHGLGAAPPWRLARRGAEVALEVAAAALLDALRPLPVGVLREEAGRAPAAGRSVLLYLHWSPSGAVSPLVLRQLAAWRAEGFDPVFVSNAEVPAADWERVGEVSALRLARRNAGRDFGAWRDAAARAVARWGPPSELLLANDSVLGPLRALGPLVSAWRAGGEGLFGLTESRQAGPHLQSYALLARGGRGVLTLLAHLAAMSDGRSKWRVVQSGEIGLSRRAREEGLRRAALFGYGRLLEALTPADLAALGPRVPDAAAALSRPLNPTHHLWRPLVERLGFPYLKTELVLNNPGALPGVERWREVVPAPLLPEIEAHLALMRR